MPELLKPPTIPSGILNFFSSQPDFAAVIGDITEEFHQRAERSGASSAKLWFWREAFRNALALTARELLRTPLRTFVAAFGSVTALNALIAVYVLIADLLPPHRFFLRDLSHRAAFLVFDFLASLAVGWIGGRLLLGREWALALTYTLVFACSIPAGFTVAPLPSHFLHNPEPFRSLAILGNSFRLGAFWLGCLWIRCSNTHNLRSQVHV
jgi:hypothetical protein